MRFHRIKLKNLNSLYGEQVVDFEEDIRNSPLFLIIGPTGAGKSTILDAVCLALFGQTPRLERRTGRAETDVAHIMSIGTAAAYAEVEFSVRQPDGERARYLATWSTRRAYDDPEGAVQRPERSLYRKFDDGKMRLLVADHREKYFQPAFDDALGGLSVEDFQRSILLAQGEFSAFLHASDSEKASILERLTNTDDYRVIGERASRRRRAIEDEARRLSGRLQEMQVLTDAEAEDLEARVEAARVAMKARQAELEGLRKRRDWLVTCNELRAEVKTLDEKLQVAQKARAERKSDYAQLERDRELSEVEPAWRDVVRLNDSLEQVAKQIAPLGEQLVELRKATAANDEAVKAAREDLTASEKALEESEPAIREAHAVRERLTAATKELQGAVKEVERRSTATRELAEELSAAKDALEESEGLVEARRKHLDELVASRRLVDELPRLQTRAAEGIAPIERRIARRDEELETLSNEVKALEAELGQFDEAISEARKERAKWQGQVTRTRNRVSELAGGGATVSATYDRLNRSTRDARERGEALREARYLADRLRKNEAERKEVHDRIDKSTGSLRDLNAEEAKLREKESDLRELMAQCDESLKQNAKLLALSTYRAELESGDPCPLCGSPVHPYCDSDELVHVDEQATADRERLEAKREDVGERLGKVMDDLRRLSSRSVAIRTALQHDEGRVFSLNVAIEEDQAAFARCAERAGYSPLETFQLRDSERIEEALKSTTAELETASERLETLEAARQQLEVAEEKFEAAAAAAQAREDETAEVRKKLERARELVETRTQDRAAAVAEREERVAAVWASLAELGVEVEEGTPLEAGLARAAERRDAFVDATSKLDEALRTLEKRQGQVERLTERAEEAAAAQREAEERHGTRKSRVDELTATVGQHFDGKDPAEVRRELESSVSSRRRALEAAVKTRSEGAQKISAAEARLEELEKRRSDEETQLAEADEVLDTALARLEITRDEVKANLLDPAVRKRLTRELGTLDDAVTRATTRLDDARKRVAKHEDARPDGEEATLEELEAAVEEARTRANDATQELGGLRERWSKHEQSRGRRAELEEEMQRVQHDLDVWNTIYGLIGVRDGERFKLFAQSLNLQGLVDRANLRLSQLHPRYRLTVARGDGGEPTLSFGVQDRYQANVERPLTTLSGGETFLVSLALALGLADYRRVDMPIETLLMDEGFGTLDQDSLHMALTTLHQLHQDADRQIGIISHVDALKDLIDTRVVVEPVGHGRSQLRFEFGAQSAQTRLALT